MATIQSTRIYTLSDTSATLSALKSEHTEFQKKLVFLCRNAGWWRREYAACPSSQNLVSMTIAQAKYRSAEEVSAAMWETWSEASEAYKASKSAKKE
jgi:hypothetical protein